MHVTLPLVLAAVPLVAAPSALAAERVQVGDTVPGFELPAAGGGDRSLDEVTGDRAVLLVLFRGLW